MFSCLCFQTSLADECKCSMPAQERLHLQDCCQGLFGLKSQGLVCVSRGESSSKSRASCDPTRLKLCAVIAETAIPKTQNEIHQPQPPCSLPALSWAAGSWSHLDGGERTSGCPQVAWNQCQEAFILNRALDHSLDAVTSARDPPCKEGVLEEFLLLRQ